MSTIKKLTLPIFLLIFISLLLPPVSRWFQTAGVRWLHIFLFAFSLSFSLVPATMYLARRTGAMDNPSSRRIHDLPTPRLGGIAIFIAFLVAILANFIFQEELLYVLTGAAMVMGIGVVDDTKGCSARIRLIVQLSSVFLVMAGGVMLNLFSNDVFWGLPINIFLTMLWVIGITNAMNFFDGMDGLASGLGAIISGFMGVIAFQNNQPNMGWISVALLGGCLGFLPYNFRPKRSAETFLGDGGSTFIGFTLACLAVMGDWAEGRPLVSLSAPLLLFLVLIFDMVHITVARIHSGKVSSVREWIEYVGKDHLHHRMEALLLGKGKAVLFIYLMTICLGISTLVLRKAGTFEALILIAQSVVIIVLLSIMERAGNKREKRKL